MKMNLRESRTSKFSGGACPRTPLGSKLWAFGKYTRLLLLSTHLCKNLLKLLNYNANGIGIDIRINGEKLDEVDSCKYLGAVVTDHGLISKSL